MQFINKNVVPDGKYVSIGDPYKDPGKDLPQRWRKAQFIVQNQPANGGGGYFHKQTYASDAFQEMESFLKTQPASQRKLAFGTHDAARRGEFTRTIRTEQYRETLRRERDLYEKMRDKKEEDEQIRKCDEMEASKQFPTGLREANHLYDIGQTLNTEFNPKCARDTFYVMRCDKPKRMGGYVTTSGTFGEYAWEHKYEKPKFGPQSHMKNFYDRSHLGPTTNDL